MSSITPLKFTGVSSFSADFQSILTRAVSIAALPVQQMQNQQATLLAKKQTLAGLSGSIGTLGNAIRDLGKLGDTSALTVSSSNTNRVTVTNNGLTAPAGYTITDITSIAKAAAETTATGLATGDTTAVDADGLLELAIGGDTHAIDISADNNLNALAAAINDLDAGVTATVLNTGSVANPFFLSITSDTTGETTLELRDTAGDSGSNLLTSANQGANAVFKLNGLDVSKPDNVISDVIPNLTFTIVDKTGVGESVAITAQSSRNSLGTALETFVSAYNSLASAKNSQVGETAGILSGDYLIHQIGRTLQQVSGFNDAQGTLIHSLADLGIELDKTGKMSFNSLKFYSLPTANITEAYSFLRSDTGGFGELAASLDALSDPVSGLIQTQQIQYDAADKRLAAQIEAVSLRINQMQSSLQTKLEQADSLLSGLQSQQKLIEASYASVNLALYGKQNG